MMGEKGKLQCKALRKLSSSPGKLDMSVVASARSCMACGDRILKNDILQEVLLLNLSESTLSTL